MLLRGVNGPEATVIEGYQVPATTNGDAAIRCVYLTNGPVLGGFTLRNGATRTAGDSNRERSGGGLRCESANALELLGDGQKHVSLLGLARIIGQCAGFFAATVLHLTFAQWLEHHLPHHLFYEQRKDRQNYFEQLAELKGGLG